jgi:seryl-tRNA synthetase
MEKLPFLLNQIKSDIEIARKSVDEENPCETIKEMFTIIEKQTRALELEVEDYRAVNQQMCAFLNITLPEVVEDDEEEYSEDVQVEDEEDKRTMTEEEVEAEREEEI